MSLFDYRASQVIAANELPFYGLIMAAYRQADTDNARLLRAAFPDTIAELEARYASPGGILPTERCGDCGHAWTEHDEGGCQHTEISLAQQGICGCTEPRP